MTLKFLFTLSLEGQRLNWSRYYKKRKTIQKLILQHLILNSCLFSSTSFLQHVPSDVYWYYLIELSYYVGSSLMHFTDVRKKVSLPFIYLWSVIINVFHSDLHQLFVLSVQKTHLFLGVLFGFSLLLNVKCNGAYSIQLHDQ